jgi:hypothetical protein
LARSREFILLVSSYLAKRSRLWQQLELEQQLKIEQAKLVAGSAGPTG